MAKSTKAKKTTNKKANNSNPFRKKLLEQQQQIMSLYEHDLKVGQQASDEGTEDIVDRANNSYNREFMFALSDTDYGEKTCIISQGLGTIAVSYQGKTYWVCCSGCKAAFEDDPQRWIARAAEQVEQ